MKQIVAIVKPFLAEKVITAISEFDVLELCVREVKGFGRQKNYLDRYGENEYSLVYVPKVEIAAWVDDRLVDAVLQVVSEISRTGRPGDGKILVLPVTQTCF